MASVLEWIHRTFVFTIPEPPKPPSDPAFLDDSEATARMIEGGYDIDGSLDELIREDERRKAQRAPATASATASCTVRN